MDNILGKRLKLLRERKKLSQKDTAKKFGITNYQLSRYESGQTNPDPDLIRLFADFFEVSTDYLLGRTDNPQGSINIHYDGGNGLELEDEDEELFIKEQLEQYRKMKERMKKRLSEEEKK